MTQYFAMSDKGRIVAVSNYVDEVAEFIDRVTETNGTFTASGQQITLAGEPTGWRIVKESA